MKFISVFFIALLVGLVTADASLEPTDIMIGDHMSGETCLKPNIVNIPATAQSETIQMTLKVKDGAKINLVSITNDSGDKYGAIPHIIGGGPGSNEVTVTLTNIAGYGIKTTILVCGK